MSDRPHSEPSPREQALLKVHLTDEQQAQPPAEQRQALQKKKRKQSLFLAINLLAIAFFGYSFYSGITQLSTTIWYILIAVFVLNVGLIFYQKKQLNRCISYLTNRGDV